MFRQLLEPTLWAEVKAVSDSDRIKEANRRFEEWYRRELVLRMDRPSKA